MKRVIIPVAVGVVMLAAGAGAGMYFGGHRAPHSSAPPPKNVHHAVYFAAINPIVVSLSSQSSALLANVGSTYLQIGFQLESSNPKAKKTFKNLSPAIRGKVIALMLDASPTIIQSAKARDAIKAHVLADVNDILYTNDNTLGRHAFQHVYITDFVTQPN